MGVRLLHGVHLKYSVYITSFLLILYCIAGFYLPTYVKEQSFIEPNYELIKKLESKLELADEKTILEMARMMANDLRFTIPERNESIRQTSDLYLAFDKMLVPLLFLHFLSLYHLLGNRNKK